MSIGLPEIIIVIVVIVILFGIVKIVGDKRYKRRSGNSGTPTEDKRNEK